VNRHERARAIVAADLAFDDIVRHVGPPPARRSEPVDHRFASVISAITSQLLATSAADTIHARVVEACHGEVTPQTLLSVGVEPLRTLGLNRVKANAMTSLARAVLQGDVNFSAHGRRSNDEVTKELVTINGIGPWTVQMYLMHTLGRHDVWPVGDYGVRMGWSLLHHLPDTITERALREQGDRFDGNQSSVAWYCWQEVHRHRSKK
jgi:DNA-3-methyladenine glycosylase II